MAATLLLHHSYEKAQARLELCEGAMKNHFLALDLLRSQYRANRLEKSNGTLRRNMHSLAEEFQKELRKWKDISEGQARLQTAERESVSELCRKLSQERRKIEIERASLIMEIAQRRASRTSDVPEIMRKAPHEVHDGVPLTSAPCSSPVPTVDMGLRRTGKRRAAREVYREKCDSVPKRARSETQSVSGRKVKNVRRQTTANNKAVIRKRGTMGKKKTASVSQTSVGREDIPIDILELASDTETSEQVEVRKRKIRTTKSKVSSAVTDQVGDCRAIQSDRKESYAYPVSDDGLHQSPEYPSRLELQSAETPQPEAQEQLSHIGGGSTEVAGKQMESESDDARSKGGRVKKKAHSAEESSAGSSETVGVRTGPLKRRARKRTKLVVSIRRKGGRGTLVKSRETRQTTFKTVTGVLTNQDPVLSDADDILESVLQPEIEGALSLPGSLPGEATKHARKEITKSAAATSKAATSHRGSRKRKAKDELDKVQKGARKPQSRLSVLKPHKDGEDPLSKGAVQLLEPSHSSHDEAATESTGRGKVIRRTATTRKAVLGLHRRGTQRAKVRSGQSLPVVLEPDTADPLTEEKEQVARPSDLSHGKVTKKTARSEDECDETGKEERSPQCVLCVLEPYRETEVLRIEEKTQPSGVSDPSHGETTTRGRKVRRPRGTTKKAVEKQRTKQELHGDGKGRINVQSLPSVLETDPLTEEKELLAGPSDPSHHEVKESARRKSGTRSTTTTRRHKSEEQLDENGKEDRSPQYVLSVLKPDRETEVLQTEEKIQPSGLSDPDPSHGETTRRGRKIRRPRATTKKAVEKQRARQEVDGDGNDVIDAQSLLCVLETDKEDAFTEEKVQLPGPSDPLHGDATKKNGRRRKVTRPTAARRKAVSNVQATRRRKAEKEVHETETEDRGPQCLLSLLKPDTESEDLLAEQKVQPSGPSDPSHVRRKVTRSRATTKKAAIKQRSNKELDKNGQEFGKAQSLLSVLGTDTEKQDPLTDEDLQLSEPSDPSHGEATTKTTRRRNMTRPAAATRKADAGVRKPRKQRTSIEVRNPSSMLVEDESIVRQPAANGVQVDQSSESGEKERKTLTDRMESDAGGDSRKVSKTTKKTPELTQRESESHLRPSDSDNETQRKSLQVNERQPASQVTDSSKRRLFSKKDSLPFNLEATNTQSTMSQSRATFGKSLSKSGLFGNPVLSQFMRNFRPPQLKKKTEQKM